MNRLLLGALVLIATLPLTASLMACGCDQFIISEEFEEFCDGVPCRWESTGSVTQVATYHSEIHGVAIPAGTTIRALEGFGFRAPRVLVRCDTTATLRINSGPAQARPSERFVWVDGPADGTNTELSVEGTGQCIVDDVGFFESCF